MKAAVVVFPGSNCDRDVRVALEASMGRPPAMVWHAESTLPESDLIVLPGGFSYGDYLRSGAMAAHAPAMREVVARAKAGVPVLAICNGFQIATEAGLLPGLLMSNASLRFVCKDVHLRVEHSQSLFTDCFRAGQVVRMPVAHRDGNYFAEAEVLDALEDEDRIAFRYCTPAGELADGANPNGSIRSIAGIFNETRTVLGMMPHPERLADAELGGEDGKTMLDRIVAALG